MAGRAHLFVDLVATTDTAGEKGRRREEEGVGRKGRRGEGERGGGRSEEEYS